MAAQGESAVGQRARQVMSESRIQWVHLDPAGPDAMRVGDVVSAEAGGLPTYRVVAIADQQAWLRDETHAVVRVAPVSRLLWKASR